MGKRRIVSAERWWLREREMGVLRRW